MWLHDVLTWMVRQVEDRWFTHLVDCERCLPPQQPSAAFDARMHEMLERLRDFGPPNVPPDIPRS